MQLLKKVKKERDLPFDEHQAQGFRYIDEGTSTKGYVEVDSIIDLCSRDEKESDDGLMTPLVVDLVNIPQKILMILHIIRRTMSCARGTQRIGTRKDV